MPRVSIGMPVRNGENFIQNALDSLLAQSYPDFELIISDNGSNDNTQEICKQYAAKDRRIRYYRSEQNRGAAWNFNHVFALSKGEYFKWAAHDDVLAPDYLRQCVEVLDRDPSVVLVYPRAKIIDQCGMFIYIYDPDAKGFDSYKPYERFGVRTSRVRPRLPIIGPKPEDALLIFGLIRSSALKTATPPLGAYAAGDLVVLARLALLGRFAKLPEFLFFNRDHPQRSIRAHMGRLRQSQWFTPEHKGKLVFPDWRLFWEFFLLIGPSPLTRYERARCYLKLGKYVLWNWPRMARDVVIVAGEFMARVSRAPVQTRRRSPKAECSQMPAIPDEW